MAAYLLGSGALTFSAFFLFGSLSLGCSGLFSNSRFLSLSFWMPDTRPLWVPVFPLSGSFFPLFGFPFLSLGLYTSPALYPPPLGFYPPIRSEQSTVSTPFPFPCGSDLHA